MGALFVVATPIGNLGDAAPRMAELLGRVSCIFAEDTRRTRRLLSHLGIRTRLLSLHGNSPESAWRAALDRLSDGDVAYVSDAGTPAVSDPGARLVALAHQHGIAVHSIPGPSAVTAALSVSGLESVGHVFLGFLPERKTRRLELLDAAVSTKLPLVVFCGPHDAPATLAELAEVLGPDTGVTICHELTKFNEKTVRTRLGKAPHLEVIKLGRGEKTLVIDPISVGPRAPAESLLRQELAGLRTAGHSLSSAARQLAAQYGLPKQEMYQLGIPDPSPERADPK